MLSVSRCTNSGPLRESADKHSISPLDGLRLCPGAVALWESTMERIPNCQLHIVPGTSYHVAATDTEECATLTLDFLRQRNT